MVCFQTDYLQVEHHSKNKVLVTQWYGGCSSLQYRQALIQIMRIARDLQVHYIILDRRLLQPVTTEDLTWTCTIYAKAYTKLPLRKVAVLQAFNIITQQQQQQLYERLSDHIPVAAFEDLTSAYAWITE
ncbi:hypothetical protein [Pontibacter burrus]|uniref:STAS/SEC14 domain-containing protein n=1 Tax=Pontibacter burrus TaxID=2704466 RepID=A0A6B3M0X5_9BACT|nr:hypothetical protein [Pontibacter burrus]NEM99488.1 hypothetical protein [Pontibacter burrus]